MPCAASRIGRGAMEQLGHSQIALTMNTYSHLMPTTQREAADRMEALLSASVS